MRQTIAAQLIGKECRTVTCGTGIAGDSCCAHGVFVSPRVDYILIFRIESGEMRRFCVSAETYMLLQRNAVGALTVNRRRFVSFDPN